MKRCLFFVVFLSCFAFLSTMNAAIVFKNPPPVEKKKQKKRNHIKKRFRLKAKQRQLDIENAVGSIAIGSIVGLAVGGIAFSLGIALAIPVLWMIGLILMGLATMLILMALLIVLSIDSYSVKEGAAVILAYGSLLFVVLSVVFFLVFLIWGLIIMAPLLWISALTLLAFALAIFLIVMFY